MMPRRTYSNEPDDPRAFTRRMDRAYSAWARVYDVAVKRLPIWKRWLRETLPHIQGDRILEISTGTGYLMSQYASQAACVGLDFNPHMVRLTRANLRAAGLVARIVQGDVSALPFPDRSVDCVVNTMAFTGYPDGSRALGEMHRVLRTGGRLVLLDIGYPNESSRIGCLMTDLWKLSGDVIRDMAALLRKFDFDFEEREVGGFGSVHLFVATKPTTRD